MTFLDDWKRCLCVCWPILGHIRRLYCHGNWYDGSQIQPANLQEYTPEARRHPVNSTANKRQALGADPELVSEACKPIFAVFGSLLASPWRQIPKPLFGSQEQFFFACCHLASLWRPLQSRFWEPRAIFGAACSGIIGFSTTESKTLQETPEESYYTGDRRQT